ncbi:hypothetical protein E3N88_09182 [Mikania micrantha]|uniref:Ty3 transposon capsid-like protein domain-containing protein n=1 Tax=Mikania micrantha TaxID=192012 RepID=A0A5N6PKJ9_9ASTR|nr:hypothetical protein E3N88_09182 [Mikania micrantha]
METRNVTRLDAQEQLIQKMNSEFQEMKSTLQVLESDRAESVEFRQVMLAWMKKQEKQKFEGSSGSGVLGGHVYNGDSTWNGEDRPIGFPWAAKKVKLPEFSGFDPQGWIQKANLYFDINHTPDDLRIRLAQLSMVGVAQHWFTIITQVRESLSWVDFQAELLQRFSGLEIHNPYEQLATLKQRDSIHDYIDDFEYLLSLVPRLPESQALGYFIAGLKEDVKQWVRLHRPLSRLDAMYLAKDVEAMLRPNSIANNLSQSRFRYLQSPVLSFQGLTDGSANLGQADPKGILGPKGNERQFASRSEHSRSGSTSKNLNSSSTESGHVFHKDRGVRSLSRTEWEERRKKGLCFRCGQQYGPAHKCPEGKLRVLLLGDDEYECDEGELMRLDQLELKEDSQGEDKALGTCLALESAGVISSSGGVKTLQFEGTLQSIPVNLMVDSGATHNFISRRLVRALGLPVSSFSGIHITLGDGYSIFVTEQCLQLPVSIGSFQFLLDVLVFDTGNLDLILGMAWLVSLGEVVHDWHHSWMQFQFAGKEVRLQGVSPTQSKSAALQQWLGCLDVCESDMSVPSSVASTLSDLQQQTISQLLTEVSAKMSPQLDKEQEVMKVEVTKIKIAP